MTVVVALDERLPGLSAIDRWLYAGQDAAWRIAAESGPLAGVPRVETAERLQRKAWELRSAFLEWTGELGGRNDSLEWWSSQLAARNSYTHFYDRVCALAATLETLAAAPDETTLVVCSSEALAAEVAKATDAAAPAPRSRPGGHRGGTALRAWTRVAPRPVRSLPARLSDRARLSLDSNPRHRRHVLAARGLLEPAPFGGPGTALLFTWVDDRNFGPEGRYEDPHFGPLPRLLQERGLEVAYVARVLHALPFAAAVERLTADGERFLFPDAYLDLDDVRDAVRRAAAFAPAIADDATVGGVPVAALAGEFVEEQRAALVDSLLVETLVRRLAEAEVAPERIVYTREGHDWELALAWAARRHLPRTAVVGYENLNMSRLALSMYVAPSEHALRPLPDRIVTNGPAFRDVLVAEGIDEETVRVGCGLRHEGLWHAEPLAGPLGRPLRVLAATELALGASAELVRKAADAFADDPAYELTVKCHPLLPRSDLLRLLPQARNLRFEELPISELLASTDVLLYTYTSVGFDALALGVPPVFVRSESTLDLDQLEFAADLRWTARTAAELRVAAGEIAALDAEALAAWRARARDAAARAVAPVRPECVEAFL